MSAVVSSDPETFVSLARVAFLVNEFFDLEADDRVAYDNPFVWWDRSKRNLGIAHPMPQPIGFASANKDGDGRGPLWYQDQIIHWFGQWRQAGGSWRR